MEQAARLLSPKFNQIIIFSPRSDRAMEANKILSAFDNAGVRAKQVESVTKALDSAKDRTVAVCGSFTILKEAKQWIEKRQ